MKRKSGFHLLAPGSQLLLLFLLTGCDEEEVVPKSIYVRVQQEMSRLENEKAMAKRQLEEAQNLIARQKQEQAEAQQQLEEAQQTIRMQAGEKTLLDLRNAPEKRRDPPGVVPCRAIPRHRAGDASPSPPGSPVGAAPGPGVWSLRAARCGSCSCDRAARRAIRR